MTSFTEEVTQQNAAIGETTNLAARLQACAEPNTLVIAPQTYELVLALFEYRDLGRRSLKGFAEPVHLYQVLGPSRITNRFEARHPSVASVLLGREKELDFLIRRWERAKRGEGCAVLIAGEPGIGKSRLLGAVQAHLASEPHATLQYFCSPYHQDSALHPVVAQLTRACGIEPGDPPERRFKKLARLVRRSSRNAPEELPLFAALLSIPRGVHYTLPPDLTAQRRKERTMAALLDHVKQLAEHQPLLIVVEDLHWANPTSLELLSSVVDVVQHQRAMVLTTARPEFAAVWPSFEHASTIALARLGRGQGQALSEATAGRRLPSEVIERIVDRADGVPLFIEELTKTVVESGVLRAEGDRYELTGPLPAYAIPGTLHASLLARLDRLASVKDVAQIAAAIGRDFSYAMIAEVAALPEVHLRSALAQLAEAALLFRRGAPPDATYQFKHALVQDAAYASMLRGRRQQLHARIAHVLKERWPDVAATEPEVLAHHLTEADQLEAAIGYWLEAGKRALDRPAYIEASKHLTKGIEIAKLMPASPERDRKEIDLQLHLAQAYRAIRGAGALETKEAYFRAHGLLGEAGPLADQMTALDGLWAAHVVRAEFSSALDVAHLSMALAARHELVEALTWADWLTGATLWELGALIDARRHLQSALDLCAADQASTASPPGWNGHVLTLTYLARALWLLGYPEQAVIANEQALTRARSLRQPMSVAAALWTETILKLWEADPEQASSGADRLLAHCTEYGIGHYAPLARFGKGTFLARFGDASQAIDVLRAVVEKSNMWSFSAALPRSLAIAHARLGQPDLGLQFLDEAMQRIEKSEGRNPESDVRRLRGEMLLSLGRDDEAETELARACTVACSQGARWWELLAATALAQLPQFGGG